MLKRDKMNDITLMQFLAALPILFFAAVAVGWLACMIERVGKRGGKLF